MMTLQQLLPHHALPADIGARVANALQLDSRAVRAGDVFIAVPGVAADGRAFISQAVSVGAVAVFAEAMTFSVELEGDVPCIQIPNLVSQVGDIAARWYGEPAQELNVLGITGTNGKTSIAWFMRDALTALGQRCALVGTLGIGFKGQEKSTGHTTPNPIALQAGLAQVKQAGADSVVMEVSSHALDQRRLGNMPVPTAIFSNLSRDHLDYHGDMEAYLAAKSALFTRDGVALAVINADDAVAADLICQLADGVRCVTYGSLPTSTVRCVERVMNAEGMSLTLCIGGTSVSLSLPLYGAFNLSNLMAVAATLHGQHVDAGHIGDALAAVTAVPGRMEPVVLMAGNPQPRVLVDYAHTPDGLEKALRACREHFDGKLICVVGCGGERDEGKRPQMAAMAERFSDRIIFTSDNPRSEDPKAILAQMMTGVSVPNAVHVEVDRAAAVEYAVAQAGLNDVVLLAGKGHETYQEIAGVRHPCDDRALARAALEKREAIA